jgi:hypothetical protein
VLSSLSREGSRKRTGGNLVIHSPKQQPHSLSLSTQEVAHLERVEIISACPMGERRRHGRASSLRGYMCDN